MHIHVWWLCWTWMTDACLYDIIKMKKSFFYFIRSFDCIECEHNANDEPFFVSFRFVSISKDMWRVLTKFYVNFSSLSQSLFSLVANEEKKNQEIKKKKKITKSFAWFKYKLDVKMWKFLSIETHSCEWTIALHKFIKFYFNKFCCFFIHVLPLTFNRWNMMGCILNLFN